MLVNQFNKIATRNKCCVEFSVNKNDESVTWYSSSCRPACRRFRASPKKSKRRKSLKNLKRLQKQWKLSHLKKRKGMWTILNMAIVCFTYEFGNKLEQPCKLLGFFASHCNAEKPSSLLDNNSFSYSTYHIIHNTFHIIWCWHNVFVHYIDLGLLEKQQRLYLLMKSIRISLLRYLPLSRCLTSINY